MTGPSDKRRPVKGSREPFSQPQSGSKPERVRGSDPVPADTGGKSKHRRFRGQNSNRGPLGRGCSEIKPSARKNRHPVYAALDLGTNNCRLLVARPSRRGFMVVDAFSRIIRLGEGVSTTGRLSEAAMQRTIEALQVCSKKMQRRSVRRSRLIATQACRVAENAEEFIDRVRCQTGLDLEIINQETEARLAVSGCASLLEADSSGALVFDIGGGSSELIWLDLRGQKKAARSTLKDRLAAQSAISCWTSLPIGVVTIAEKFGGHDVTPEIFEQMVTYVMDMLKSFEEKNKIVEQLAHGRAYLLGTSGTVTTLAGIYLGLPFYDRRKVDGCWLSSVDVRDVSRVLVKMSYEKRAAQPCIGSERADLVLGGCAILEAIMRTWPCDRLRVADRGLREGILATLMAEDSIVTARPRQNRHQNNGSLNGGNDGKRF
ncbi:MAG: Ppx/GppA family phosphatase [Hyphomicrobiaceae bacterium]|nr:Ppx/GppA family phosphatase [Hyphomicrobiaceae bacterium]